MKTFLPLCKQGWSWPQRGYGRPSQSDVSDAALRPAGDYWWHNWLPGCAPGQVPLLWREPGADLWRCNDGRPLLLFNEPELPEQGNLQPERAAEIVRQVAGRWQGPLYGCGTLAHSLEWVDQVVAAYGPGWPAAGWHVHVYSGRAQWRPDIASPAYVEGAMQDLDAFIARQRERGRLGAGVVVSEYGALRGAWEPPVDLLETFRYFERELARRPEVLSRAWFSSYYDLYPASNLLRADGSLTALGLAWRER